MKFPLLLFYFLVTQSVLVASVKKLLRPKKPTTTLRPTEEPVVQIHGQSLPEPPSSNRLEQAYRLRYRKLKLKNARWISRKKAKLGESVAEPGSSSSSAGPSSSAPQYPQKDLLSAPAQARLQEVAPGVFRDVKGSRQVLSNLHLSNKLSAKEIQEVAIANYADGNAEMHDMASAGNWGKAVKNLARDLMRGYLRNCNTPDVWYWDIPLWNRTRKFRKPCPSPSFCLMRCCTTLSAQWVLIHSWYKQTGLSYTGILRSSVPSCS